MKLFFKKFLVFIILTIGLAWLTDFVISNLLRQSRQRDYGVWNDLLNGRIDSDIVIHGSSRAWVQLDPLILEQRFNKKTYNLGLDAFGFHMQYCRHLLLLKFNKKPSTIIHILDYSIFDKDRYLFNSEQFFPYLNDSLINAFTSEYEGIDIFDRKIPALRYAGKQVSLAHATKILLRPDLNEPDRYKGFQGQTFAWNDDLEKAKKRWKNNFYERVDSAMVNLFRNYIIDCREKNIQLLLANPPEYIEGRDFVKNRKEIFNLFKKIAQQNSIPFLDYSEHPMSKEKHYFYNSEHLNRRGAETFTTIFCEDLKKQKLL